MLGWLLLAVLGIIWGLFLLPYLRRGGSPVSSVEEFERKMDFLAETNKGPRGRWVLTPRKGARFLRARDRNRSRVVQRRRRILAGLAEGVTLALLIGLFPLFHVMLYAAAVVGVLLLAYTVLLVRVRIREDDRARARRADLRRHAVAGLERPTRPPARAGAASRARGRQPSALENGGRDEEAYGFDGYGAGWTGYPTGRVAGGPSERTLRPDEEIRVLIDDDVHLVVHRSQDIVLGELDAAAR